MASKIMNKRIQTMISNALIADAATMPLHWIYSDEAMNSALEKVENGKSNPEFFELSSCPFYGPESRKDLKEDCRFPGRYELGMSSVYGEQLIPMMEYMVANNGEFIDGNDFSKYWYNYFKKYNGRLDHPTKEFLANYEAGKKYPECGANDSQVHGLIKVIPLVARYHGKPELIKKVEEAIRTHQNNDIPVIFGIAYAVALESLLLGETDFKLIETKILKATNKNEQIVQALEKGINGIGKKIESFVYDLGMSMFNDESKVNYCKSCGLPQAAIFATRVLGDGVNIKSEKFVECIRENILFGGDNCSRSILIGAALGAAGYEAPIEWAEKTNDIKYVDSFVESVVVNNN